MRTFHKLDLIEEVLQDPYGTVGQRNFDLFKSYSFAFNWYTEVQIDDSVKSLVGGMPTIEEFVTTQIGENNLKTVLFDHYIGWTAEDSRELFELCFKKIKEYESQYPVDQNDYSFKLKQNVEGLDLRKNLKHMFLRPVMYGLNGLAGLRAYLDGYFKFKKQYQLELSEYESRLFTFITFWKNKVNKDVPFETWDRPFRLECMGTTDFSGPSIQWEFERFEEILKEELKMDLESIKTIE